MSIAILNQVYDETRRLTIAGSSLAVGDFRMKKLIDPLKKSGQKAPVFAKIADQIEQLVDGTEKDSPQALLDLSSLVLAVLYTQGATGVKGKATAIDSLDVGISTTQVSSRVLKPVLEALSTTGSGRLEAVREAYDRGAFSDLRLVNPAINAMDDVYPELADFMADNVLPKFGPAIVPMIKDRIDIKGRAGHVRRLKLLYQLDPKLARPIVEQAFENGSKEMKIAALGCLGDSKDDLPHLMDQVKARAKDVRRVVFGRLINFTGKDVEEAFTKALSGADVELVAEPISRSTNKKLVAVAQSQTQACFDDLLSIKDKKKKAALGNRLDILLECFRGRKEKTTAELLMAMFSKRSQLMSAPSGDVLFEKLCHVIVSTGDKKLLKAVADIHSEIPDKSISIFQAAVIAVLASRPPKQAYDELHGYYATINTNKRRSKWTKADVIEAVLCRQRYFYHGHRYYYTDDQTQQTLSGLKWDPRWLDLAIANQSVDVVRQLATTNRKAAGEFLVKYLRGTKKREVWEQSQAVSTLIDLKNKHATDVLLEVIAAAAKKKNQGYYGLGYHAFPLISKLPKASLKKVEAAVVSLPESYIDQIMPYLVTLKQKAK